LIFDILVNANCFEMIPMHFVALGASKLYWIIAKYQPKSSFVQSRRKRLTSPFKVKNPGF